MVEKHVLRAEQSVPQYMPSSEDASELFARGIVNYEMGDIPSAYQNFELALKQAKSIGNSNLISRTAAFLGLLKLEDGESQTARQWLNQAQSAITSSYQTPWCYLLSTLIGITNVQIATKKAEQQLAIAKAQLMEEISTLEIEAKEVTAHLHEALKPSSPTAQTIPPSISHSDKSFSSRGRESITIKLLGRFEVRLSDETPINLCSNKKGQAIFKLMVTKPNIRYHKEYLLSLLWRDEDPTIAMGKLHIAVSRLRRSLTQSGLGRDILLFEDDCYFFTEGLTILSDLDQFEAHLHASHRWEAIGELDLAMAESKAALELYDGEYLADIVGDDWPLAERVLLEEKLLVQLKKLARWHFGKDQFAECAEYCRKILRNDNLREDIYRLLFRCLSREGQRNQALLLYQDLTDLLREELGVEPMRETQDLVERIFQE